MSCFANYRKFLFCSHHDTSPIYGASTPQPITINGSNFETSCKVLLRDKTTGDAPIVTFPGPGSSGLHLLITTTLKLATADWTAEVVNTNGASSGEFKFHVQAPRLVPAVSAVLPNPMPATEALQFIMINGHNFAEGCTVKLTDKKTGEIFPLHPHQLVIAAQIVLKIKVTGRPSTWSVQILNPTGDASNAFIFQVVDPAVLAAGSFSSRWTPAIAVAAVAALVLGLVLWRLLRARHGQVEAVRACRSQVQDVFYQDLHDGVSSEIAKVRVLVEQAKLVFQGPSSTESNKQVGDFLASITGACHNAKNNVEDLMWTAEGQNENLNSLLTRIRTRATEFERATGIEVEKMFDPPGPTSAFSVVLQEHSPHRQ